MLSVLPMIALALSILSGLANLVPSWVLKGFSFEELVQEFCENMIPVGFEAIGELLPHMLNNLRQMSIIGIIFLVLSASRVFRATEVMLGRAVESRFRDTVQKMVRSWVRSQGMFLFLLALQCVLILCALVFRFGMGLIVTYLHEFYIADIGSLLIQCVAFACMYYLWVQLGTRIRVSRSKLLKTALLFSSGVLVLNWACGFYIEAAFSASGFWGSLHILAALMTWAYFISIWFSLVSYIFIYSIKHI